MMQWYYMINGLCFGPVDAAEICRLITEGRLTAESPVCPSGGEWCRLSDCPEFSGVCPTPAASGGPVSSNRVIMARAREALRGRWTEAAGGMLLYIVLVYFFETLAKTIPAAGVFTFFAVPALAVGATAFFLALSRRAAPDIGLFLQGFRTCFFRAGLVNFMTLIFIVLWSLLFVIPGIAASFSYALWPFVLADEPGSGVLDSIRRSKMLMRGHRWRLFCLGWRFFGWFLLGMLTFGIAFIWVLPYMQTSLCIFYNELRQQEEHGQSRRF